MGNKKRKISSEVLACSYGYEGHADIISHFPFYIFHLDILHTARSTPNTSFLHDAFGNVTNAADTSGNAWQFSYTHNSTLTNEVFTSLRLCDSARETNALAGLVDAYSRPIGYDLVIGDTLRSRTRYGYDNEGRVATLSATNAANRGFQIEYLNESGYNYGCTLTTPNGAILTRTVTRDPYRRSLTLDCTTRFNNVEVASFAYSFDANSRPVTRNNDRFAYNDRDEITSALIGTNNINRAYDTIGNHVFCAFNSATNFYANNQLNQTTASYLCVPTSASDDATPQDDTTPPLFDGYDILSTNKFTWSAQGGLQRDGRFVYAFDAEDQLTSVTSSHLTNGAIRVVNAYDYRHRRISKTVYRCVVNQVPTPEGAPPSPASTTTWDLREHHDFVYDDWNLIHEIVTTVDANSTTNVTEIEYFWGPDLSNTLQGAGGVGGLLAVSMNGAFYFPVYDNLGNIVKYLDENGSIVASYTYDDFGRTLSTLGSMSAIFFFRFSTKYFDSETKLYYYGYRYYSSERRFWLSLDPIGEAGGMNLFAFCHNRSVNNIDVLGLDPEERNFGITYVQMDASAGHGWIRLGYVNNYIIKLEKRPEPAILPVGIGFYPQKRDQSVLTLTFGVIGEWSDEWEKEYYVAKYKLPIEEWNTKVKNGATDYLFSSEPKKCCRNVTKEDVISCIRKYAKVHSSDVYRLPAQSCRTRAKQALDACCLTLGEKKKRPLRGVTTTEVERKK